MNVVWDSVSGDQLPLWETADAGIFQANGIAANLQYVASGSSMATLLSGQEDIAHVGGSEVLNAEAGGADLVILASPGPVYPYQFYVQGAITAADQLKGKSVGISSPGSSSDTATRVGLRQQGLVPDQDVTLVPTGSITNLTAALVGGAISGGVSHPPDTVALDQAGLHPLFDMAALKLPFANNVIAAQRSWVRAHPDLAQKYVDSIVQGIAREKGDRPFSVNVLGKYYQSQDDQAMGQAWDYYTQNVCPSLPTPTVEQFTDIVDQVGTVNERVKSLDVGSILDASFVQSAGQRGLAAP